MVCDCSSSGASSIVTYGSPLMGFRCALKASVSRMLDRLDDIPWKRLTRAHGPADERSIELSCGRGARSTSGRRRLSDTAGPRQSAFSRFGEEELSHLSGGFFPAFASPGGVLFPRGFRPFFPVRPCRA